MHSFSLVGRLHIAGDLSASMSNHQTGAVPGRIRDTADRHAVQRPRGGLGLKILFVHNYYRQLGGEDVSVNAEIRLLERHGHEVVLYCRNSVDVEKTPAWMVAANAVWNRRTYREARALLRDEAPKLIHCTNTFPLISPSIYRAAAAERVPVVQALRNYRRMCANACFYGSGGTCEICLTKTLAWPSVVKSCYRSSHTASTVYLAQQATMRWAQATIGRYYALTEFARRKFLAAGIPADRLDVKPNFIDPDPGVGRRTGDYVLFAGRLSPEKGIAVLLEAWRIVGRRALLKIVGDGPDRPLVEAAIAAGLRIDYCGPRTPDEVLELAGDAACVVLSSKVYETFGRTIVEAFSRGVPVVVPRIGALGELADHGVTGFCFEPGDAAGLAESVLRLTQNPELRRRMGDAARVEFESRYTADVNYRQLMAIYGRALAQRLPIGPQGPEPAPKIVSAA